MSCFTMSSERLHQYVDGEVSETERVEVEGHLAACGRCREARARLDALRALIRRGLADPEPAVALAGLWPALERRLDAGQGAGEGAVAGRSVPFQPAARRAPVGWWRRRRAAALTAAAVLLVLAVPLAGRWLFAPAGAAEVASVEGGESTSVMLLAGNDSQPPIIWVTERSEGSAPAATRGGDPL